jgi:hypothetical protein
MKKFLSFCGRLLAKLLFKRLMNFSLALPFLIEEVLPHLKTTVE